MIVTGKSKPIYTKKDTPIYRPVDVKVCPYCGCSLTNAKIASLETRFTCEQCGTSIANTRQNRCPVCGSMCADSDALMVHRWKGCPYAGSFYPGSLLFRPENPVEKVVTLSKFAQEKVAPFARV